MTSDHSPLLACPPPEDDDEIDLLDLLIVLARNKFFIAGTVLLFALGAAGATFFMTPTYEASARFLAVNDNSLTQIGIVGDIVKSREVLSNVALQLNLAKKWNTPDQNELMEAMKKAVTFKKDATTMVIQGTAPEAQTAADLANMLLSETEKTLFLLQQEEMAFVQKRKTALQTELQETQRELNAAEEAMRKAVEIFGTTPELKKELADFQNKAKEISPTLLQQLPDGGVAYLEALRTLRSKETLYFSLINQFNSVLYKEKAGLLSFQVLEKAAVPATPSRPRKKLIVVLAAFLGGFLGIFGAFIREFFRNARKDPERKAKLDELSAALRIFGGQKKSKS
ncbi:hypothetical protein MASR1M66_18070 [Aminivibrio sp.]